MAEVGYDFILEGRDGWTQANHHGTNRVEGESRDKFVENVDGRIEGGLSDHLTKAWIK